MKNHRLALFLLALLACVVPCFAQACEAGEADKEKEGVSPFEFDLFGSAPDFEITPELLASVAAEAHAAVAKTEKLPEGGFPVRLATRKELAEVLTEVLTPQFRVQFDTEEDVESQVRATVDVYSRVAFAIFKAKTAEVLVCEKNFQELAETLERPALATPEVLRVILVHELVHGLDHLRYGWDEKFEKLGSADEIRAFSAVLEGHAQHVARKVAAAEGWTEHFEAFTEAIGLAPDTGEPAIDYMARVLSVTAAFDYYDGERFIDALVKAGGQEAVAKAFREPPAETVLILRPQWYLDPASRPKLAFDLEARLTAFGKKWDEETWLRQQVPLLRPQLEAALSLLPAERTRPVLDRVRQALVLVLSHREEPAGTHMVAAGLFEAEDSTSAAQFVVLQEELMRAKDEQLSGGQIKIKDVFYEPVLQGAVRGLYASKTIEAGPFELTACTFTAARGQLVLEISYVGEEIDRDGIIAVSAELLALEDPEPEESDAKEDAPAPADE